MSNVLKVLCSNNEEVVAGIPTQPLGSLVGFDVIISAVGTTALLCGNPFVTIY